MSGFLIRDGLLDDIEACLALDHQNSTDYVWQMNIQQSVGQWQAMFKTERLPRAMQVTHQADAARLRLALADEHCFVVAVDRESTAMLAYLTMRSDPVHHIALVQDLVVDTRCRRAKLGSRLLNVARQWAREHDHVRLTCETQTKNYPSIQFCQANGMVFCGFNDRYLANGDIAVFFSQSLR